MNKPRIPPHSACHRLVKFVAEEIDRQGLRERDVMIKAGGCDSLLSNWKRGRNAPTLLMLEAVMNVLGFDIVERRKL